MTEDGARLARRLQREHSARVEAEQIAEETTRRLFETVVELQRSQAVLAETSELVGVLQRVAVAANEASTFDDAVQVALDTVCAQMHWPVGHLYVTDEPGHLAPTGIWHLDDPERCREFRHITERTVLFSGEGLPGRVLASGNAAWIPDVTLDPNFPRAGAAADIEVRAGLAFPVLIGAEVIGVLEFFAFDRVDPNPHLLDVMANVGTQLGRVVERQRGAEALRASEARTRQIIETANDAFVSIDGAGRVIEWNGQAERHFGWAKHEVVGQLLAETIIPSRHRPAHADGIARFLASGEGPVLGRRVELEASHRDGHEFPIELTAWAVPDGTSYRFNAFIHDITERRAFQRELEHQSLHDSLTGLPNRALLLDRLRTALARSRRDRSGVALLFIDLDRFKTVNDSFGHEAGDQLLQAVAARLPGVLRPGDTLARLSGDEFVVLCEEVDRETAVVIADRMITALNAPFVLPTCEAYISASIGVAVTSSERVTGDELLADADLAMYRAKERGKGVCDLFDDALRKRAQERMRLERALRRAIDRDELVAHYQPILNLATGRIDGAEALVRWQHPERGLLVPSDFVRLAEETGLVGPLGTWMLKDACKTARRWRDESTGGGALSIAINLSVRELEQPDLVRGVAAIVDEYGVDPASLIFEITESTASHDAGGVIRRLWELRELGVALALDDFGTGYSSLDRLRRMPVSALKIDRSFVTDMDMAPGGTSLVAAIIAMAHSLGLTVVAEGVETAAQLGELRRLGCDQAQGFFIARPTPISGGQALTTAFRAPELGVDELDQRDIDVEEQLRRLVAAALADGHDAERTTRSLLAELRRLAGSLDPTA